MSIFSELWRVSQASGAIQLRPWSPNRLKWHLEWGTELFRVAYPYSQTHWYHLTYWKSQEIKWHKRCLECQSKKTHFNINQKLIIKAMSAELCLMVFFKLNSSLFIEGQRHLKVYLFYYWETFSHNLANKTI